MTPPTAAPTTKLPDVVEAEIAKFENTLELLAKGAIDADKEFKPYRLVHGVYGQRQQGENQMVRIKLKYGVVTPSSVQSHNVAKEVMLISERKGHILPVHLEPTTIPTSLKYPLAGIQHIEMVRAI